MALDADEPLAHHIHFSRFHFDPFVSLEIEQFIDDKSEEYSPVILPGQSGDYPPANTTASATTDRTRRGRDKVDYAGLAALKPAKLKTPSVAGEPATEPTPEKKELAKKLKEKKKEAHEKLIKLNEELGKVVDENKERISTLENTCEEANSQLVKAREELEEVRKKNKTLSEIIEKVKEERRETEEENKQLREKVQDQESTINKFREDWTKVTEMVALRNQEIDELRKDKVYYKNRVKECERTAENLTEEILKLEQSGSSDDDSSSQEEEEEQVKVIEMIGDSNLGKIKDYLHDSKTTKWNCTMAYTTEQLMQAAENLQTEAKQFVVMTGINHIRKGEHPRTVLGGIKESIQLIRERHNQASITLVSIPPLVGFEETINRNRMYMNAQMKKMEENGTVQAVVNIPAETDMDQDGFHIRKSELQSMAYLIEDAVARAVREDILVVETTDRDQSGDYPPVCNKTSQSIEWEAKEIAISNATAALIVGKGGQTLKRIQEKLPVNVSMLVTKEKGETQRVIVTAPKEEINGAMEGIRKRVREMEKAGRETAAASAKRKETPCRYHVYGANGCPRSEEQCWYSHKVKVQRVERIQEQKNSQETPRTDRVDYTQRPREDRNNDSHQARKRQRPNSEQVDREDYSQHRVKYTITSDGRGNRRGDRPRSSSNHRARQNRH